MSRLTDCHAAAIVKARYFACAIAVGFVHCPCLAGPTQAQMNQLWLLSTAFSCIAQSADHDQTQFATSFGSVPKFNGWESFRAQPRARCLAERQWIPKSFCNEVLEIISLEDGSARLRSLLTQRAQDARESEPINRMLTPLPGEPAAPFVCPIDRPSIRKP